MQCSSSQYFVSENMQFRLSTVPLRSVVIDSSLVSLRSSVGVRLPKGSDVIQTNARSSERLEKDGGSVSVGKENPLRAGGAEGGSGGAEGRSGGAEGRSDGKENPLRAATPCLPLVPFAAGGCACVDASWPLGAATPGLPVVPLVGPPAEAGHG